MNSKLLLQVQLSPSHILTSLRPGVGDGQEFLHSEKQTNVDHYKRDTGNPKKYSI